MVSLTHMGRGLRARRGRYLSVHHAGPAVASPVDVDSVERRSIPTLRCLESSGTSDSYRMKTLCLFSLCLIMRT